MIEILDRNFKKIDVLRRYVFAQYHAKSRDIGNFEIQLKPDDKATKYLMNEDSIYYVLFDSEVLGKIEKIKKDSEIEGNKNIILTGRLSEYILTNRVIFGTIKYSGKSYKLIEELINKNIIEQKYTPRYLPIEIVYEDEQNLINNCSNIEKQITGGYVWDEAQKVLEQDKLNLRLIPEVKPEHDYNGIKTNISKWFLYVSTGKDLTQGEDAVIFSQVLSNVTNTNYERDIANTKNVAYVAGEGEEANRKWYEVQKTSEDISRGWEREELWVDARDIQSKGSNDETLTPEQYQEKINIRGQEKLSENIESTIYDATVAKKNIQEQYGKKYVLGDWVLARDVDIGIQMQVQITGYIKSWGDTGIIQDIELTYGTLKKDIINNSKTLSQQVSVAETNIQYILNNLSDIDLSGGDVEPISNMRLEEILI